MKLLAFVLVGLLSACTSVTPRGHLVIAGGGTRADNDRIYGAFFAPLAKDAVVGVVPTASASSAESAESSAKTLTRHSPGRTIVKIDLPSGQPERANDPAVVQALKECSALWFTGGVQSRILTTFRPATGDTPAYHAATELLARGGVIGGTSAGAAMMSDPMIAGGNSEDALLGNFRTADEDSGLGIGKGMGFFPFGLVDQHFLRRGRIGRLIIALEQTRQPRGYGIEENSALAVNLGTGELRPVGSVALIDITRMTRQGSILKGVRVSLLHDGDVIDGHTGKVTPIGRREASLAGSSNAEPLPGAWSAGAIERALIQLASHPDRTITLESPGFALHLHADSETACWLADARVSITAAILDIAPRPKP